MDILSLLGRGISAGFECVHFRRYRVFVLTSLLLTICHASLPQHQGKDRSRTAAGKGRDVAHGEDPGRLPVLPAVGHCARVRRTCWPAISPISVLCDPFWRIDKYHKQKLGSHEHISRNTCFCAHKKRDPYRDCDVDADREGTCCHAPNERG